MSDRVATWYSGALDDDLHRDTMEREPTLESASPRLVCHPNPSCHTNYLLRRQLLTFNEPVDIISC